MKLSHKLLIIFFIGLSYQVMASQSLCEKIFLPTSPKPVLDKPDYLFTAAYEGDMTLLEQAVNEERNLNIKDKNDWTPLMYAGSQGHEKMVLSMIKNGADPSLTVKKPSFWDSLFRRDEKDFHITVVGIIIQEGHYSLFRSLLNSGFLNEFFFKSAESKEKYALRWLKLAVENDRQLIIHDLLVNLRDIFKLVKDVDMAEFLEKWMKWPVIIDSEFYRNYRNIRDERRQHLSNNF